MFFLHFFLFVYIINNINIVVNTLTCQQVEYTRILEPLFTKVLLEVVFLFQYEIDSSKFRVIIKTSFFMIYLKMFWMYPFIVLSFI